MQLLRRASRSRRRLWSMLIGMLFLTVLVGYALVAILWHELPALNVGELFTRVGLGTVVLASLVYALDLAIVIVGWGLIIGGLSGVWDWMQHTRIYAITSITRRLPGTVWYIFGRMVLYERLDVPRSIAALAGGLEFVALLLGALLVALITWPLVLSGQQFSPLWIVLIVLVGGLLLNPYVVRAAVRRFSPKHTTLDVRYRHMLGWIVLFALAWAVGGVMLFIIASAVHPLTLAALPAIIGVWAAAGLVAMLLSFMPFGLQELTLSALLIPWMNPAEALVVALVMRALLTVNEALWALIGAVLGLVWPLPPLLPVDNTLQPGSRSDAKKPEEVYETAPLLPRE